MHFGKQYHDAYFVVENAWHLLKPGIYEHSSNLDELVKRYTTELYTIDRRYRYFYFYYDRLEDNAPFEALRDLVERVYTNDFLNPLLADYSAALVAASGNAGVQPF